MAFLSDVDAGDAGDGDDEGGAADDDGDACLGARAETTADMQTPPLCPCSP